MNTKNTKERRAKGGWFNWYINRKRLAWRPTARELRAISWRRVF